MNALARRRPNAAVLFAVTAVLLVACGATATPTSVPAPAMTSTVVETTTTVATGTTVPAETAVATSTASAVPSETPAAESTATVEATAMPAGEPVTTPVVFTGPAISFNGIQFQVAPGLAVSVTARVVPTAEASADTPPWGVHPQYTEFVLGGYPSKNTYHQPRIEVYPAAALEASSEGARNTVPRLRALLAQQPALPSSAPEVPTQTLPFMPLFNAAQIFHAKTAYLAFENGTGIRFVTQYDQAFLPINNQEVFYTFQGLTNDGLYYVVAILPVTAPVLAGDDKIDTTGPDIVPFPANDATLQALRSYLEQVIAKLDALREGDLTPDLDVLDAMMQSMRVGQ